MTEKLSAILITGLPGTGKTTIVKKLSSRLNVNNKISGFFTEEVRDDKRNRIGFDVATFNLKKDILARISPQDMIRRPHIGKYSIFIDNFERIALSELKTTDGLIIIDEIGKMELLSRKFETELNLLLQQVSNGMRKLVATIPSQSRGKIEIVDRLKSMPNTKLFEITKQNRDGIFEPILDSCLKMMLK